MADYSKQIEESIQGFYRSTPEGKLVGANQAFAEMLGYEDVAELLACTDGVVKLYVRPELRARFRSHLDYHGAARGIEFEMYRRDGRVIWVHLNVRVVRNAAGGVECYEGTAHDVTRRRRREGRLRVALEKLKETTQELARSNEELNRLANVLSHDLREPLRTVSHFLALLSRPGMGQNENESRELIRYASDGAKRMTSMVNALLDYSKAFAELEQSPVACNEVLEEAKQNLRSALLETGARVESSDLPCLVGNRTQLVQLFQNLIANALKFKSGELPVVRVTSTQCGPYWLFIFGDNGVGFAPQDAKRLFGLYFRGKTSRPSEGSGIGLSICQKIVQSHGGSIWADSLPGKGSQFSFTLKAV